MYPPFENSTTHIAIVHVLQLTRGFFVREAFFVFAKDLTRNLAIYHTILKIHALADFIFAHCLKKLYET